MNKVLKYVPVFFLLLAGLILSAHMVIPHDHHITDPFSDQDRNCPSSNSHTDHKSGFPVHCHAFNDIATDKVRLCSFSPIFQFGCIDFVGLTDSLTPYLQVSNKRIIDFQKPVFDIYALEFSLLRAPPVLA